MGAGKPRSSIVMTADSNIAVRYFLFYDSLLNNSSVAGEEHVPPKKSRIAKNIGNEPR